MRTHQEIDRRSLALHRAVADKIRRDPGLLQIALDNLDRWQSRGMLHEQRYLDEWRCILGKGMDDLLAIMVDPSERATALRQSSPFSGVLSPRERMLVLKNWSRQP